MPHFIKSSKFRGAIPTNPDDLGPWLSTNMPERRNVEITFQVNPSIAGADSGDRYGTIYYRVKNAASEQVPGYHLLRVWLSDSTTKFQNGMSDITDDVAVSLRYTHGTANQWLVTNSQGRAWGSWFRALVNMDSVMSGAAQISNLKASSAEAHAVLFGGETALQTATFIMRNWIP